MEDYVINGSSHNAPLLVVGFAGAGKSALMAKSAHGATNLAKEQRIRMAKYVFKYMIFFSISSFHYIVLKYYCK